MYTVSTQRTFVHMTAQMKNMKISIQVMYAWSNKVLLDSSSPQSLQSLKTLDMTEYPLVMSSI